MPLALHDAQRVPMKLPNRKALRRHLEELDHLDAAALRAKWHSLYGTEPPSRIGAAFLRLAVAYRMQEVAFGGLTPATKRLITRLALELDAGGEGLAQARFKQDKAPVGSLPVGAQLVREWNGGSVVVDVLPNGFAWRGQRYGSLSAVATAITGTRWSGPRFFGLRARRTVSRLEPTEFTKSIGRGAGS